MKQKKQNRSKPGSSFGLGPSLFATALGAATLALASWTIETVPDLYYRIVQEDQALEWATFLAFMAAAVLFSLAGYTRWREERVVPWFAWGVALFCLFVAMEEISWAQRVFAYRPPTYFLANNFQQELNLHNVVDDTYRKLAVKGVLLGYGVVLPVLGWLWPRAVKTKRRSEKGQPLKPRWTVLEAPPLGVAPLFLMAYLAYEVYPWDFTGEWIELIMGFGFLFAGLAASFRVRPPAQPTSALTIWAGSTLLAGALVAVVSDASRRSDPGLLTATQAELDAIAADLAELGDPCQSKSHVNKRLYSYEKKYREPSLYEGRFAGLAAQGLPEDRALYFLDPWNSPYWIQCTRRPEREFGYVYSFGPNRGRESDRWEIRGDDLGAVFFESIR